MVHHSTSMPVPVARRTIRTCAQHTYTTRQRILLLAASWVTARLTVRTAEEKKTPRFRFNRVLVESPGALATTKYTNWLLFVVLTKESMTKIENNGPMKTSKYKPVGNIIGTSQHEWRTIPILGIIFWIRCIIYLYRTKYRAIYY